MSNWPNNKTDRYEERKRTRVDMHGLDLLVDATYGFVDRAQFRTNAARCRRGKCVRGCTRRPPATGEGR